MIHTHYDHDEVKELINLLKSHHSIRIVVRLLDLDHKYIDDYSSAFAGGQVNYDMDAEITRSLDLVLFDPTHSLHLDQNSPQRVSVYIDKMISIVYVVIDPYREKVFKIPVFCGPIDSVERNDMYLSVKCLGKESLSIGNLWRGKTFKKAQEKTRVMKKILSDLMGETKISIGDKNAKLPNDMHLNRSSAPWVVLKKLAKGMGFQLFYDGRGYAKMRRIPKNVVWTPPLTSVPQIKYDLKSVINAVEVNGKKPKKGKKKIQYRAYPQPSHPLSPKNLGRGGVPRYIWRVIDDDSIRTKAEAKKRAKEVLENGLRSSVEVTYNGMPNPMLEEGDVARCVYETVVEHHLKKWTLPLVADQDASYGYIKRPTVKRRRSVRHRS